MREISKAYEPQSVEAKWYPFWVEHKCFVADPARVSDKRPAYSIVIPPPNVTGMLHMGHVLNNTIQDILARKARMDGKEVLWLPGTDHAGIATEGMVAKQLHKEEKKTKRDIGREEFLKRVWAWKEKHGGIIIEQLKKLGCSCDWTRERFTMDPHYVSGVQKVFVELHRKGLIYRGKRMVNWCPASLTALSDEEVEMEPQKGFLWYFQVEVAEDPGTFLTIATTRPETIPGDTGVAVHPNDPRYRHLVGKHAIRPLPAELPISRKLIPIIADDHIDPEFGTGVLKVTPAHDKADFEIGQRHRLPAVDIMNPNGMMNELAGAALRGLDRFEARKVAVEELKTLGSLVKEVPYENKIGFSQRARVPIEPRLSEQWFLKYPSVEQARACVAQDDYASASNLAARTVRLVSATGKEISGATIRELRRAALVYARQHGFLGRPIQNEDSRFNLRVGRQSLSHAFSHPGIANIQAVAVLPELIRTAIWLSSESHAPPNPAVRKFHRFVAGLSLGGELHRVLISAKEYWDGTILYDHKAEKITPGGKSLEAHPREGKLDTQPAPSAEASVADLLSDVNDAAWQKMRFHPQRWAKVYDHWLTNIQDWCISRQLWWGHRIPVWYRKNRSGAGQGTSEKQPVSAIHPQPPDIWCDVTPPPDPENWEQDPDVLDTWCSSWLWPFATMGWPEQTETLKKFYPTTDLVTAPDIIFFWVARMIMAGYEFMGDLPFRNVYFTGLIRDKQGRKMSKTLGNSPDPLELIAKYGADALRFGTMRSAPLGQDVLFDEKDVELGRNFCNKLWNACRFRQMQGGPSEGEIDPAFLTNDDKWILLKLDQALREIDEAFAGYRFSEVTQTLYRFFWSEYCDWYVEASKAVLQTAHRGGGSLTAQSEASPASGIAAASDSDPRRANKLAVIDFILSNTLRLFHPFLPFITEELWHGMNFNRDLPGDQGGGTIMFARWPKPLDDRFKEHYGLDESIERFVNAKYELVSQGRNLRRAANIPSSKKVKFVFKAANRLGADDAGVLKLLLNADPLEMVAGYEPPKGTPSVHSALGELYLPLEGLVDVAGEKLRLAKELAKVDAEIEKVQKKLNNSDFVGKVPPTVLEEHKNRLTTWESKRTQLQSALDRL